MLRARALLRRPAEDCHRIVLNMKNTRLMYIESLKDDFEADSVWYINWPYNCLNNGCERIFR